MLIYFSVVLVDWDIFVQFCQLIACNISAFFLKKKGMKITIISYIMNSSLFLTGQFCVM